MGNLTSMSAFRRARDYKTLDRIIAGSQHGIPPGQADFIAFLCAVQNLGIGDRDASTYAQTDRITLEQWREGKIIPDETGRRNAVLYMRSLAIPYLKRDC